MTTEQKAKAYDEAIERAKKQLEGAKVFDYKEGQIAHDIRTTTYAIFPKLKDSEDGQIREEISELIMQPTWKTEKEFYRRKELVDWLEKQGEQKLPIEKLPEEMKTIGESLGFTTQEECDEYNKMVSDIIMSADKVEPKFKVGDWVTNGRYAKLIVGINSDWPFYMFKDGTSERIKDIDKKYHLWTIKDAKTGDVLYSDCLRLLWIFKGRDTVYCGCNLNCNDGAFCVEGYINTPTDAIPATKEQRDLLFQKMKEAGYEFDFTTKELKKIEQKSVGEEMVEALRTEYEKGRADAFVQMQKEWSEEDKDFMYDTLSNLTELKDRYGEGYGNVGRCIDWVKDLKNRVQPQPKQEWSEEDEEQVSIITNIVKAHCGKLIDCRSNLSWLKSLKDRYTWKPSDEQMRALDSTAGIVGILTPTGVTLCSLYHDLKKLKGE